MKFIKPSPCMFVCIVADRVGQSLSECETLSGCMSGVVCTGCMSGVVCMCMYSSRAFPVVIQVARCMCSFGVCELTHEGESTTDVGEVVCVVCMCLVCCYVYEFLTAFSYKRKRPSCVSWLMTH